jgi:hypothetical protein
MANIDVDIKQELKDLRAKVRQLDRVFDFNTIFYSEFVPFVFKIAKNFDNRLDEIEAKLESIEKAFADRFPA